MWIKNFNDLATSEGRQKALQIIEAGLNAVKTDKIIREAVKLSDHSLTIKDQSFPLKNFKRVGVIGFGKASCEAALALEEVLGSLINDGLVIDIREVQCEVIKTYQGTHPLPSGENVNISQSIVELAREASEDDLILVAVSGGGSALLCWPQEECDQGQKLYHEFLTTGGTIQELNIIRKHISFLKGGGLAKLLYPATVAGLIFCDVPGNVYQDVASGPTYKDETTVEDAKKIIEKYGFKEKYNLTETPKDNKFFERVFNIPLVSNDMVLLAMVEKAHGLGLKAKIVSNQIYDFLPEVLEKFFNDEKVNVLLAGGEVRLEVKEKNGSGGRNQYLALGALKKIGEDDVFVSLASDGLDNSEAAGAIVDRETKIKVQKLNLAFQDYLDRLDTYNFFKQTKDLIITGPTGINVADLMILLKGK